MAQTLVGPGLTFKESIITSGGDVVARIRRPDRALGLGSRESHRGYCW